MLQYGHVDGLVQNAGVVGDASFDVNLFGVCAVFEAFQPLLEASSGRAMHIIVASEFGAWTAHVMAPELQNKLDDFANWKPKEAQALAGDYITHERGGEARYTWPRAEYTRGRYGVSKALVLALGRRWAHQHRSIATVLTCPGYCKTTMNIDFTGSRSAADGASSVLYPLLYPDNVSSGGFYQDGKSHPWVCPNPFAP
ncbi:hypothetical protein ACHHYP_03362 [Achlya hypogyna]|uniref:Uncharacterized protein n=1 Tax=Achlya hypogyna TaxID=1202772 RepID=A0A1V9Z3S6_ACHHY|nr:hypothetical protein ACHHYP_03362 [Achlya hypogyna]